MKNICLQTARKAWLVAVMAVLAAVPAFAQKITVTGTVVDPEGEPLIGASVLAKGTSNGTATDIDGNYTLDVAGDATLVFSYVGYNTQEVAVAGRTRVDVTMSENSVMLQEVVAIGYGVVKKSDATGSVAVIKPDDIEAGIANSVQDLLVGASPGVTVTGNGGNPNGGATIRIRGGSSISASNDPLIVIDGVPQTNDERINGTGVSALTMLNPSDIESMTVLKDASATAIYGSRASNGVIIVTTKKGSSGAPKVTFSANWHVAHARKTFDVLDGEQYRDMVNSYYDPEFVAKNGASLYEYNTDWQKEILRTAFSQDYNLSVAGTAGWLPYRVSASWASNQGIIKDNDVQRTTVGFSLSPKFFNGKLSINANANGTYLRMKGYGNEGTLGSAIAYNPTAPVSVDYPMTPNSVGVLYNGLYYLMEGAYASVQGQGTNNPLDAFVNNKKLAETYSSTGNLQIDYALHFLPDLHVNLNLGYEVSKSEKMESYLPGSRGKWGDTNLKNMGSAAAGTHYKWWELRRNTLLNVYLNYRKEVAAIQSNFDVMAGYEWQRFTYLGHNNSYVNTLGYVTNEQGLIPVVDGKYDLQWDQNSAKNINKAVPGSLSRWSNPLQLISFFGRFNYSLQDTYLFTFTLRDDGTSRFSKDNRWGLFPSVALGWRAGNMPVFEDVRNWWNELKFRAGWGITGQQDLGGLYFPYLPTYTFAQGAFMYPSLNGGLQQWVDGAQWTEGNTVGCGVVPLYPKNYDSNIKWEETTTWNLGLDFGFLNNRITASVDWYLRQTNDMLYAMFIDGLGTAAKVSTNVGNMENTGVEVTVTARPVVTKNFTWTTGINWAYNKSKITKLTGDKATDSTPAAGRNCPAGTGSPLQYFTVNQAPFAFFVYEQVFDADNNPVPGVFVDQNGDGQITPDDKIYFHDPAPLHTLTWNNTFNWKNWDLGFTLRANLGNWVYNGVKANRTIKSTMWQYGWNNLLADSFYFNETPTGADPFLSTYYIENASFLRCDNISLGYTFNNVWRTLGIRVFAVVENPFVITKYKGTDPEVFSGIDGSVYPNPTTYSLGVVCNF